MRHSDLIDPADLHFSKFKTFSGSAALVTPDFANQLIAATDSNKVYRATGTTQGAVVELLAPSNNNGGTGDGSQSIISTLSGSPLSVIPEFTDQLFAALDTNKIYRATGTTQGALVELSPSEYQQALIIGETYPSIAPEFVGQQYLYSYRETNISFSQLFVARGLDNRDWFPVCDMPRVKINISDNNSLGGNNFDLYFSRESPSEFSQVVHSNLTIGSSYTLAVSAFGIGYYAIAPANTNLTGVSTKSSTSAQNVNGAISPFTVFNSEIINNTLTANGFTISSEVAKFLRFPLTPCMDFYDENTYFELSFEVFDLSNN